MKVLLIILDGLADRQVVKLGRKTPLEAALTPNLDSLAKNSINGVMYPISPGVAPSSDLAHFIIFGYKLHEFPGRGYLEALGEDIEVSDDEVILRTFFVTVEQRSDHFEITERFIPPKDDIGGDIVKLIPDEKIDGVSVGFVYTGKRQGLLILKGDVSPEITDADPFSADLPVIKVGPWSDASDQKKARKTADVVNEFMIRTFNRLKRKDNNFVITKWAGQKRELVSFFERYSFTGASLADSPLYKGLAKAIGLDYITIREQSEPRGDLERRISEARRLLDSGYDLVHVHSKVPDQAGHTKKPEFKKSQIEQLDLALSIIVDDKEQFEDTLVVVTADHATPSEGDLIHSGEPTPILMFGKTVGADSVTKFNEASCASGMLGVIRGSDLMPLILNYTDRIKYLGSRSSVVDSFVRPTRERINPLKPYTEYSAEERES